MTTSIDAKIISNNAKREELQHELDLLTRNKETIQLALNALGWDEEKLWSLLPCTDISVRTMEEVHYSYLNLLVRVLSRTTSITELESYLNRFADPLFLTKPSQNALSLTNQELMKSKFVNLLDIHGEVRFPTPLEKFKAWVIAIMDRLGQRQTA